MKHSLLALLFTASAALAAPQVEQPRAKFCSEMTKDSTRLERSRCVKAPVDPCANLTKDATRIERSRCEKKDAKKKASEVK